MDTGFEGVRTCSGEVATGGETRRGDAMTGPRLDSEAESLPGYDEGMGW